MNKYETVFISDPDLQDQTRKDLFDKVRNIIANEKGFLIDFDEWGNKKLAYEIRKKNRGHYVCVTYGGTGDLVRELERNFRLTDDVFKFMTILLEKGVALSAIEEEARRVAEDRAGRSQDADGQDADEKDEPADDENEKSDSDDKSESSDEPDEEADTEEKEETE